MISAELHLSPAERWNLMQSIVIQYPRFDEALKRMHYLVELGRLSTVGTQRVMGVFAESQSGKSTIALAFSRQLNTPEVLAAGEIPVLHITVQSNCSPRSFAQDILKGFQDFGYEAFVETGTEAQMVRRILRYLKQRKVRLLIVDEFHHLVRSEKKEVLVTVSEKVKHLLLEGTSPIVVAGLPVAKRAFTSNKQLANRAEPHLELRPLDPQNAGDPEMFRTFLAEYLATAEQLGAAGNLLSYVSRSTFACIWEVSQGVLGAACNLVKDAVKAAAFEGRHEVSEADLLTATDWAIGNELYDRNPFREGQAAIRPKVSR